MTASWLTGIDRDLERLARTAGGNVGIAVRDLDTGHAVAYGAERVFPSASVIKLPILVATLTLAEAGELDLDRSVALPYESRVGGSGILKELRVGALAVRDLLTLMTVLSDNTATNACLGLVGFDAVNDCAWRGGCTRTRCERLLMDHAAGDRGLRNETTALDMAEFVTRLTRGELLTGDGTSYALDLLRRQQARWGLPRRLPADVDLAHKTGELAGLRHDVGLLTVGSRRAAVAVLCGGFDEPSMPDNLVGGAASDLLASAGELIHAAMSAAAYA